MKTISIILAYQFGACTKEEKCVKTALPAMDNLSKVNGENMVLIGILLAMLTEVSATIALMRVIRVFFSPSRSLVTLVFTLFMTRIASFRLLPQSNF